MSDDKKSKKNGIEKLRIILDDKSLKKLDPKDEKYLIALKKRLDESSSKKVVIKQKVETEETDEDSLKPKVVIHARKQETKPISPKIVIEEKPAPAESEPVFEEVKEEKFEEDLIEIKKIEIKEPEFLEVKPKGIKKEEKKEPLEYEIIQDEKEEIAEFKPIEKEDEKIDFEEVKEEKIEPETESFIEAEKIDEKPSETENVCPKCGTKIKKDTNFCQSCGYKINGDLEEKEQEIKDEKENVPNFIPVEKTEEKHEKDVEWKQDKSQHSLVESGTKEIVYSDQDTKKEPVPPKEEREELVQIDLEKEKKKEAFKEIESIDEETAVILYDHGFTSVDALNISSIRDIAKIPGIKKKKAKEIKKEVDKKANEIFGYKPLETEETAEGELTEEQAQVADEDIVSNEEKIAVFNDIKSIDEETAILLFEYGYNTLDTLKNTTVNDLVKIPGLNKRKAKKIISEIEEKIIESAELKPIHVDETAQGEVTEEQIEEKTVFEEEDDDYKMEFDTSKAEWASVEEEKEFKEEKIDETEEKTLDWEPLEEDEDLKKIEVFAEIESIDGETAVLLYNHGYTSIDSLKNATFKDIKKIKGIKKKKAKDIIFEIENRFREKESDESLAEDYDAEYFEENDEKEFDKDLKKVDEKIKKFEEPKIEENEEDTEFFQEEIEKDMPKIKPDEKEETIFGEIESIDDRISTLLIENDIDTIEKLNDTSIKELTKIRGIRKKIAKQIKREVEMYIKVHNNGDEGEYKDIKENPYLKDEDDEIEEEWESIEKKKSSKGERTIYGYMYSDYTLYEKEITTKSGNKRIVRFFSKGEPENAKPIDIPEGYEVEENKSGVPYLRKIKD